MNIKKDELVKSLVIATTIGAIVGGSIVYMGLNKTVSNDELIKGFYDTETAVGVSPHGLRGKMDKGDTSFILVDLRSQEEYEREHVVGAINIPAYKDPETSAYGDTERIINSFKELGTDKEIITYCYSVPCMTGRKVGKMLSDNGIYVKALNIGWNEWRYDWTGWNHEHEWDVTNVEDYIATGSDPGKPTITDKTQPCTIENEFGC